MNDLLRFINLLFNTPVLSTIVLVVILAAHLFICIDLARCAGKKGYSAVGLFFACFFIGLPVYILIAAFPDKAAKTELEKIQSELYQLKKQLMFQNTQPQPLNPMSSQPNNISRPVGVEQYSGDMAPKP